MNKSRIEKIFLLLDIIIRDLIYYYLSDITYEYILFIIRIE